MTPPITNTMTFPPQPEYETFIPAFMRLMFAEAERVCLCSNVAGNWDESMHTMDEALHWLLQNRDTPNLYFRASAFGPGPSTAQANCASVRALFLDIDYGSEGHKGKTAFKTLDDVTSYLLTMPLQPSLAWHTGHGIQCAYLLDKPCVFPLAGGDTGALFRYTAAGDKLRKLAMGDAAFTPEHAYRVPLTLNSKGHSHDDIPDVTGSLLWCEPLRRYALEEIEKACESYDIKDLLEAEAGPPQAPEVKSAASYDSLPQDLKDEIEDTGTECSDRLFSIIGTMVRAGYDSDFIVEAVGHGTDFKRKYGRREGGLRREVENCIAKLRKGHYVYNGLIVPSVQVYNTAVSVQLKDCGKLPEPMELMLSRYSDTAGIETRPRVRDALRFHEHLSDTHQSCVMESPCGAGKSVWALCHIASQTSASEGRHVYVIETVDALHKAADMIESLAPVKAGRLHGFNEDYCAKLSGKQYTWEQCIRGDPHSMCLTCNASAKCAYFTREEQERSQVLCMTHSGFIRALEDGSALLTDAHVIIDEGLSPFDTFSATLNELKSVTRIDGVPYDALALIFPCTSLAQRTSLINFGIKDNANVFARTNYVYRNEAETSAIADVISEMRKALRTGSKPVFGRHGDAHESAKDTLASIVNFFRPSARSDASYAYRETPRTHETPAQITCKRSVFSLSSGGPWKQLHMLNASAQLSPFQYPDNMPVFTCKDIPENSNLVTLHCVKANPTKTKLEEAVNIGNVAMFMGERTRLHSKVLVCLNKDAEAQAEIEAQVRRLLYNDKAGVTVLTRGRIKGVNSAGDCTLALLQGMSLFTGIDDCALHAALHYRRTFPDTNVFKDDGKPKWGRNGMEVPAMRDYYALRSLDEIYQAIWRTAVRNDRPVEAVIVIPDAHWLAALYRTVMPLSVIGSAYKAKAGTIKVKQADGTVIEHATDFVFDSQLYGIGGVCALPPGTEITKEELAKRLGYAEWERNSVSITDLLGDLFEPGSNIRYLKRKS